MPPVRASHIGDCSTVFTVASHISRALPSPENLLYCKRKWRTNSSGNFSGPPKPPCTES